MCVRASWGNLYVCVGDVVIVDGVCVCVCVPEGFRACVYVEIL